MDGKAEEEEEVEFQEGDVDLEDEVAALHAQIGGDVLVDGPREFVVEFPRDEGQTDGSEAENGGDGDEIWSSTVPDVATLFGEAHGDVRDLFHLDCAVDEQADVVDDETDDLNGVLQSQAVPDED